MDISNCVIWLKYLNVSIWVKKVFVCVCVGEGVGRGVCCKKLIYFIWNGWIDFIFYMCIIKVV